MSDDADIAAEYTERLIATAHRAHDIPNQDAPGHCVWCHDPITDGRFCDKDCAEDWGRYNRRQRNGG